MRTWMIALALGGCTLAFTGCTSSTGGAGPLVDPIADPPPACDVAPVFALGAPVAPIGAPSILHTPEGDLDAHATVVSVDTGASLVIVLDVEGDSHRIEIVGPAEDPGLEVGQEIGVELTSESGAGGSTRETLVVRSDDGAPLALYTRGRGWGVLASGDLLNETFDVEAAASTRCRVPTGGQCGRGVIVRELWVGDAQLSEGESDVIATESGQLRVNVHALADDNDGWVEEACAVGPLVSDSVDAVVAPSSDP